MYSFTITGEVVGLINSYDGQSVIVRLTGDEQDGVSVEQGDTVHPVSVRVPMRKLPDGVALKARLAIQGNGYIGGRNWVDRKAPPGTPPKVIENTRLQATDVKLLPK